MNDFLKRYRTRLKLAATQELEKTITQVFDMISDDSDLKNTVIILRARYQNLEVDEMKGIVAEPDRVLRTNRIMNSLFELIDNLKATDLQESEDVMLNDYLQKMSMSNQDSTPVKTQEERTAPTVNRTIEGDDLGSRSPEAEEAIVVNPKSAKDLEIFSEMNRSSLSFFPVIYRDVRTIVIRNGKASVETGTLIQALEKQLPAMTNFKNNINQLEPILKKIRVDQDKKVYWLQFQQLSNKRTTLQMENLSDLTEMNSDLDDFIKTLREKGIVS